MSIDRVEVVGRGLPLGSSCTWGRGRLSGGGSPSRSFSAQRAVRGELAYLLVVVVGDVPARETCFSLSVLKEDEADLCG